MTEELQTSDDVGRDEESVEARVVDESSPPAEGVPSLTARWLVVLGICVIVGTGAAAYYWYEIRDTVPPERRFNLAVKAIGVREYGEAEKQARILEKIPGYEPHVHYLRGALLLNLIKNPERALPELQQASQHKATRLLALVAAGEALYYTDRKEEAVGLWQEALNTDFKNVQAHRWLAVYYYDTGAMDDAVRHLAAVGELAPTDARPHRLLGNINKDYERYESAIIAFKETLRREPYQVERNNVLLELAQTQVKLHRYRNAFETLSHCTETPDVLYLRAVCLRNRNDLDKAKSLLEQALEMNPNHSDSLLLKGTLALESNQLDVAEQLLQKAVKLYPNDDAMHVRLAEVYRQQGKMEQARKQLEIYKPLRERRLLFAKLNVDAIQQKENAPLRVQLGNIAKQMGRPNLARMWYEAALDIKPDLKEAADGLASLPPRR